MEIKPGGEGVIRVEVNTGAKVVNVGRIVKTVEVRTNDPNNSVVILAVSGEVVPR